MEWEQHFILYDKGGFVKGEFWGRGLTRLEGIMEYIPRTLERKFRSMSQVFKAVIPANLLEYDSQIKMTITESVS